MCRFETSFILFLLNIGREIDLESWRRKLDVYNRGYRKFYDLLGEIEFLENSVWVSYRHHSYSYIIYRNGDIDISFDPDKDFYGDEIKVDEILKRGYDDLTRENLSKHIQSLTKFLHENGLDIPSKFIVKRVIRRDELVPHLLDRDKWTCYIDLERFEMMYENKMNIENKGTYLIIRFQSIHPNLKITVELGNQNLGGYAVGQVESSDQTPIDVLSDEGFSVIKDYLAHLGSALYDVKKAIEEIKAYELVSNEVIAKKMVEQKYKKLAELLSKELYGDDYEQWLQNKDLVEQIAKKLLEWLFSDEKLYNDDDKWWP